MPPCELGFPTNRTIANRTSQDRARRWCRKGGRSRFAACGFKNTFGRLAGPGPAASSSQPIVDPRHARSLRLKYVQPPSKLIDLRRRQSGDCGFYLGERRHDDILTWSDDGMERESYAPSKSNDYSGHPLFQGRGSAGVRNLPSGADDRRVPHRILRRLNEGAPRTGLNRRSLTVPDRPS